MSENFDNISAGGSAGAVGSSPLPAQIEKVSAGAPLYEWRGLVRPISRIRFLLYWVAFTIVFILLIRGALFDSGLIEKTFLNSIYMFLVLRALIFYLMLRRIADIAAGGRIRETIAALWQGSIVILCIISVARMCVWANVADAAAEAARVASSGIFSVLRQKYSSLGAAITVYLPLVYSWGQALLLLFWRGRAYDNAKQNRRRKSELAEQTEK